MRKPKVTATMPVAHWEYGWSKDEKDRHVLVATLIIGRRRWCGCRRTMTEGKTFQDVEQEVRAYMQSKEVGMQKALIKGLF